MTARLGEAETELGEARRLMAEMATQLEERKSAVTSLSAERDAEAERASVAEKEGGGLEDAMLEAVTASSAQIDQSSSKSDSPM